MLATLNHRRDSNESSLFVSIEGRFLCNDTHTFAIAVTFIPVISSNKRIFHFPSIHSDHLISFYFIIFREERERLCREQKKVISFTSEGNLIKVDFDGLGEIENRFNGYFLIPRERQLFYRLFPFSSLIVSFRQTHRHSRFRRFLHGC